MDTTLSLSFWVSKSVKFLKSKSRIPSRRYRFDGMVVNNSAYCDSPDCVEVMMNGNEITEELETRRIRTDLDAEESGESSLNSDILASDVTLNCENSSSEVSSSPPSMVSPMQKPQLQKQGSSLSESEMMKERFAKLLLGEDMSGCGNGVCTALALSNAITNLCATLFGQIWRLEPLQPEKKLMWRREMDWLLCVSDHIVELIPSFQPFPDGSKLEIMTSRPRADLYVNLPALRKLDNMLLEILGSFENSEFWYVEQGISAPEADGTSSFRRPLSRQEDKWWLPVPQVRPGGLSDGARKMLQHRRDSTNQILKAAMAINNAALAEMDIPDSYLESLPKNGKASLGDAIHRYINSDQFSPECLLDCLGLSSEHQALEMANKVEAAVLLWRRKMNSKPLHRTHRSSSRSSWEMVKDLVGDADKREVLAGRAEGVLVCLKQRFPGLPQTALDMSKIQYNKDVGKSILESYSRVLESLAFNIVARIDDLLYVDNLSKHSDQLISISKVGLITPSTFESSKVPVGGFGVKRMLTDYLNSDGKTEDSSTNMRRLDSFSSTTREMSPSLGSSSRDSTEVVSQHTHEFVMSDH